MKIANLLPCFLRLAKFSVPLASASVLNMSAHFIAILMVAQLGTQMLAAATLAMPIYLACMTVTTTSLYAIGILISHDPDAMKTIGAIVKNGVYVAIMMALVMSMLLWHGDKLLFLFGENTQLVNLARSYFHYASLALLPTLIATVISQFYIGINQPKIVTITVILRLPFLLMLIICFNLWQDGSSITRFGRRYVCLIHCANPILYYHVHLFVFQQKNV